MQYFYDPANNNAQYAFGDDVVVTGAQGLYVFTTPFGAVLGPYPSTLIQGMAPPPSLAVQLVNAQTNQIATLTAAYQNAVVQPVTYTSVGGVTKEFEADPNSQTILLQSVTGFNLAGSVPPNFFWKSQDNTEVLFTLDDLKGLYAVMLSQGWTAFQNLQVKKSAVNNATLISVVEAVVW
jgi:hypothetical protein